MTEKAQRLKKWSIPGVAIVAVAAVAFAFGKSQGTHPSKDPAGTEVTRQEGTGVERERLPESPSRAPASVKPDADPETEDYRREDEEEVEVQVAHSRKPVVSEAHASEKTEDLEKETASTDEHEQVVAHQSKTDHHSEQVEAKKGFFARLVDTYARAWVSMNDKVQALRRSEEENHKLRLENAHLRVMMESQNYAGRMEVAKKQAQKVGAKLNAETGTKVGRTLATVSYQIPENLLPDQIYTLGVGYFKAKDYEKAAAIFTFLTEMEGDSTFRTTENYLMTGVTWYRLENYKLSETYFERVLKEPSTPANQKAQVQAKVWRALAAARQKQYTQSQKWLKETLENHPQSQEARWINPQEGDRVPASTNSKKTNAAQRHEEPAETEAHH